MLSSLFSLFAVFFLTMPRAIMGFFTDDPMVITMGRTFFLVIALTEPVAAVGFALRGGGDPNSPFILAALTDIGLIAGAGYLFAVVLGLIIFIFHPEGMISW